MSIDEAPSPAARPVRSIISEVNFLARSCDRPYVDNGNWENNLFPLAPHAITIFDAETFATPPRLEVEGFSRATHTADVTDIADSFEAQIPYRDVLATLIKTISGADEIVMGSSTIRRQALKKIGGDNRQNIPADMVHSDSTEAGASQVEKHFFAPPTRPRVRRTALYNLWNLLSNGPTTKPLAVCDARSVRAGDVVTGRAFFPHLGTTIDTAFFHPNDHFRWAYYPSLKPNDILIFKQFDSDMTHPVRVPHSAFADPSAPVDAAPRVSIESRCIARWYE